MTRNGPRTYAELRRRVEATLLIGQRKIEGAKVRTYWETGRLIRENAQPGCPRSFRESLESVMRIELEHYRTLKRIVGSPVGY